MTLQSAGRYQNCTVTLSALFPNLGFLEQDVHDALREIKGAQVHTFPSFTNSHRGGSSYSQEVYKVTLPAILDVISAKMAAASCAKGPSCDIFEPSWTILGFVGANLEQSWLILAQLASSWGSLGTLLGHLRAILDHLKIILMESWTISNPKPKFNDSFTFLRCFNLQWPSFK